MRTSPAPIDAGAVLRAFRPRPGPRPPRAGFTLLEALLALVILLLATQITGQSLLSVVRVSRSAALDREAAVRVRNLASDAWLGVAPDDFPSRHTGRGWILADTPLPEPAGAEPVLPWGFWTLSNENRAFLPVGLAFTRRSR